MVGGALSGPKERVIVEQPTGTVVEPCSSRTVQEQNCLGQTRTTTSTNCP